MRMVIIQVSRSNPTPPDKPIEFIVEREGYWNGQVKHIKWLELHNEDCDATLPSDQDQESNDIKE